MKMFAVLGVGLVVVTTALALLIKYDPFPGEEQIAVRDEMSLRHIAERNNVSIDAMIPLLPPERRTGRARTLLGLHKPVKELGLRKEAIVAAVRTAQAAGFPATDVARYILWSIWLAVAGGLLLYGRHIRKIRAIWLVATLTVFGLLLGAAPNPMEAVVKFHKLIQAVPGNPAVFVIVNLAIFTLLSSVGAKMLCSWGCQLGALQETLYNLPILKNLKRKWKLPFAASISVRITVYLLFFVLFFELLNINQGGPGSILYHHFNMFKIYDFYDLALFTLLLIPVVLIASLVIFRPFCQLLCPFGLYSWLLENVALYRVRKTSGEQCNGCRRCEDACPTDAMKAMNDGRRRYFLPDCWSCGSCIDVCPTSSLQFVPWWSQRPPAARVLRPSLEDVFVEITGIEPARMRKEKEKGGGDREALDRLLLAPIPLELLMLAKTSGAVLFGTLNAFVPVVMAAFVTDLSGVARWQWLPAVVLVAVSSTFLGLFIALSVSEVFEAQTFSNFFRFPMVFLCGLFLISLRRILKKWIV